MKYCEETEVGINKSISVESVSEKRSFLSEALKMSKVFTNEEDSK